MKKIEERCYVDGSSALKIELLRSPSHSAAIIAFPGRNARSAVCETHRSPEALRLGMRERLLATDTGRALRNGNARGVAYECVKPWQAVVAGGVCIVSSLAAVLVGF